VACSTSETPSIIETVRVRGGKFVYGRDGDTGGKPERVAGFRMGKYPVTQGQWKAVMGGNPSGFDGTNKYDGWDDDSNVPIYVPAEGTFNRENLPVETVGWYEVLVFANKLSMREGLKPAYIIAGETDPAKWGDVPRDNYDEKWYAVAIVANADGWRMPSELQWEFAAKGGTKSSGYTGTENDKYFKYPGSNGDDDGEPGGVAWYGGNSDNRTHEVGKKQANELGLYDMGGNVWEWCFDTWDDRSVSRVLRGGNWGYLAEDVRSAARISGLLAPGSSRFGVRLVRP